MSKKPENTFIGGVHKHMHPSVYFMKNNNPYVGGVPDVWYSGNRGDLWVEYKYLTPPTRDTTLIDLVGRATPDLSVLQQEWLTKRHAEGRMVAVIVGSKDGGVWMPGLSWSRPMTTADFKLAMQSRTELAEVIKSIVGGP